METRKEAIRPPRQKRLGLPTGNQVFSRFNHNSLRSAVTSSRHKQTQSEAKDDLRSDKAYLLGMDALLLTILGAGALLGVSVFLSSEIQRKQGKTDAQISSRENNTSFWLPVLIGFVIFVVIMAIKGE